MPTPIPPGMRLGLVNPEDAAQAFERRGLLQPSFRWQDTFQEEHARAFSVAGVMRLDILEVFRAEVERSVSDGDGVDAFRKSVREQLVVKGWWGDIEITDQVTGELRSTTFDDRRLRLIYDVNLRQSHAAGRWARIERLKDSFPYVTYRTMRDERVRASHAAWDGVTLPVDHPFWQTHFPPNGWRCRCQAFAVDDEGIKQLRAAGVNVETEPPKERWVTYHNPSNDTFVPVPHGVDPGFAYNPGMSRDAAFFDVALQKAQRSMPREAAVVVTQALFDNPSGVAQLTSEFGLWVDDVLAGWRAVDRARPRETAVKPTVKYIGVVHPWAYDQIRAAYVDLLSPVIGVGSQDVKHTLLDKNEYQLLPLALYKRLPELLLQASAALLDTTKEQPVLLYVVDIAQADGRIAKLVIELGDIRAATVDGQRAKHEGNWVRTVGVVSVADLRQPNVRLIWGRL